MKIAVCILLVLTAVACDRDDESDALAPNGSIKLLLDNRSLASEGVTATLSEPSGEILVITANFIHSSDNTQLSIAAYSNNTNDVISTGEYEFASKIERGPFDGVCTYVLNDGNAPFSTTAVEETYVGKVNITELDRAALIVSGTFEATVGRNGEVKSVTKGSFTKIPLMIN
jgi:hypothetical protein